MTGSMAPSIPMGNRTSVVKTDENGVVVESSRYGYNESSQLISMELYDGKKTTAVTCAYDADGNLVSETGKDGTEKVEKTYLYAAENFGVSVPEKVGKKQIYLCNCGRRKENPAGTVLEIQARKGRYIRKYREIKMNMQLVRGLKLEIDNFDL